MKNSTWFLVILVAILMSVSCRGPQIHRLEYLMKSYADLSQESELMIITAHFDRDIYTKKNCTSGSPTQYSPCNGTLGCLDGITTVSGSLGNASKANYYLTVANPRSCFAVLIRVSALQGDPDLSAQVPGGSEYSKNRAGDDLIEVCCADIVSQLPSWNGTINVSVTKGMILLDTRYSLELLQSPVMNASVIFWREPIEIVCEDSVVLSRERCLQGGCIPLPPTNDPFFSYLTALTGIGNLAINPRQAATSVVTRARSFSTPATSVTTNYIDTAFLAKNTCKLRYNFVDDSGESSDEWFPLTKQQLTCNFEDFTQAAQGLTTTLSELTSFVTDDKDSFNLLSLKGIAHTVRNEWVACQQMLDEMLTTSAIQTVQSTRCVVTNSSSDNFINDPCCDAELQRSQCCVARNTEVPVASASESNINDQCLSPRCSAQVVSDYVNSQFAKQACQAEAMTELSDTRVSFNPFPECRGSIFKTFCSQNGPCTLSISQGSLCLGVGYCSLPCQTDNDCTTGQCIEVQREKTCFLYDQRSNQSALSTANGLLLDCLVNKTNPFVQTFITKELGLSTTSKELLANTFVERLLVERCVDDYLKIQPHNSKSTCEAVRRCNWADCTNDANPKCTLENCQLVDSPNFCQTCFGTRCFDTQRTPSCEYLAGTEDECNSAEASIWYPLMSPYNSFAIYGTCRRTSGQCLPANYCTSTEISSSFCAPKCLFVDLSTESMCDNDGKSWDAVIGCQGNQTSFTSCQANGGFWWPGTALVAAFLSTQEECEQLGACYAEGQIDFGGQADCLNAMFCENGPLSATNQSICEEYGTCSDYSGCHFPFPCSNNEIWTPNGCYAEYADNAACATYNGAFLSKAPTLEECKTKGKVCRQSILTIDNPPRHATPVGVSLQNQTQCELCNGYVDSFYTFTPSRWIRKQWTPSAFRERNYTQAFQWRTVVNEEYYASLLNRALYRRMSSILGSNILCRFGALNSTLTKISCDCGADAKGNCYLGINSALTRSAQICTGVSYRISFELGTVVTGNDVDVEGNDCVDFAVALIGLGQFEQKKQVTLSSSAVTLSQSGRTTQILTIKNRNNIAVGQVIGPGVRFQLNRIVRNAQLCYDVPSNYTAESTAFYLDMVRMFESDSGEITFTPMGLNQPLTASSLCIPFDQTTTVFLAALIEDWNDASFIESLFPVELFVIYFGASLYLVALGLWSLQLIRFLQKKNAINGYFQLPTAAFWILGFALLDRLLYLLLLSAGVLDQSPVASAVFAELPALMYYTIFSLIIMSWSKVYHFTKSLNSKTKYLRMKTVLISLNAVIGLLFITVMIVFFSFNTTTVQSCTDEVQSSLQTPQEIVGIVYKIIFAILCISLSIIFAVYGARLVLLSNSLQNLSLNDADRTDIRKSKKALIQKVIVTVVGTVCLLGQAVNLIRASFSLSDVYILFFIYCVELVPVVGFLFILKKAAFTNRKISPVTLPNKRYRPLPTNVYRKLDTEKAQLLGDLPMTLFTARDQLQKRSTIPFNEIKVQQQLGEGNFGTVSLGEWQNIQVALKASKGSDSSFVHEAELMLSIPHHPNIVKAFGASQNGASLVLVMEFCNGLSLDTKLFDLPDIITDKEKLRLLIGIAHGVNHLHKNNIVHRDLAARNVLLQDEDPKISDFGLSKKVEDINEQSTTADTTGPIRWMSPEALHGIYYAKTDVWTFGIVMFEVLTQCEPHNEEDTLFVGLKIRDQGYTPHVPAECDRSLVELMTQCWSRDPRMRPDMATICQTLESLWKTHYGNGTDQR